MPEWHKIDTGKVRKRAPAMLQSPPLSIDNLAVMSGHKVQGTQ
jgi:hypothetical protein